jgi:branched-chain amino acid transport system permease protein
VSGLQFALELIFTGLCVGAVYSLIALGFNITFWTTKVVNFGHGPFIMFCSMLVLSFLMKGLPWIVSIPIGFSIIIFLGFILERFSIRPLLKYPTSMGWIVSTLGVGLFLQALASKIWGAQALAFPPFIFEATDYISIFGIQLSAQYLLVLVMALVIMLLMEVVINKTIWGKAMKAVAHDPNFARVMGIKSKLVMTLSFMISALLAGVAGILVAPIYGTITPEFGMNIMVLGFVAAVLGGIGSSKGALFGGLTLGVIEKLVGGYISTSAEHGVAFLILIIILALKPDGFFGVKVVQKV